MKYCIVAIYDHAVRAFRPHCHLARTPEEAQRQARNLMAEKEDSEIHRTPQDFSLYILGTVDVDNGDVQAENINLGLLSDYLPQPEGDLFENQE